MHIQDSTEKRKKNQRCKEWQTVCKVWKNPVGNVKIGKIFVKFGVDGKEKCVIIKKQESVEQKWNHGGKNEEDQFIYCDES